MAETLAGAMGRYGVHSAVALAGSMGLGGRGPVAVSDLLRGVGTLVFTPGREWAPGT